MCLPARPYLAEMPVRFNICLNLISEYIKRVFYNGCVHWEDTFCLGWCNKKE